MVPGLALAGFGRDVLVNNVSRAVAQDGDGHVPAEMSVRLRRIHPANGVPRDTCQGSGAKESTGHNIGLVEIQKSNNFGPASVIVLDRSPILVFRCVVDSKVLLM